MSQHFFFKSLLNCFYFFNQTRILCVAGELKHVLSLSKPRLIFCSPNTIAKMVGVLPEHPYIENLVLFGNEKYQHAKVIMYEDIVRGKLIDIVRFTLSNINIF